MHLRIKKNKKGVPYEVILPIYQVIIKLQRYISLIVGYVRGYSRFDYYPVFPFYLLSNWQKIASEEGGQNNK